VADIQIMKGDKTENYDRILPDVPIGVEGLIGGRKKLEMSWGRGLGVLTRNKGVRSKLGGRKSFV